MTPGGSSDAPSAFPDGTGDAPCRPPRYPRDMRGHGPAPIDPQWPGGATIAVQFVLNYEEGGENCLLHGDRGSEAFLSEIVGASSWEGERHWNMESIYEYGARAGFWRVREIFDAAGCPVTVFGVATALARSPEQTAAMRQSGWEIASHGLKWIDYRDLTEEAEWSHMQQAIALHQRVTGSRPEGWYTGRCSMQTVALAARHGEFLYLSDSYADDLPYWVQVAGREQLIVPYTLDANDMRFATAQGFNSGEQFYCYLKDSFDQLRAEGEAGAPRMMSIGIHCRLVGRPGRALALRRFIDYIAAQDRVWIARRIDIARHWRQLHPADFSGLRPSVMSQDAFLRQFGGVFEHSEWVAARAHAGELGPAHDCIEGVHAAMCSAFRAASHGERLAVLKAHPDLAGRLALARRLTDASTAEQQSAGLDVLSDDERLQFEAWNAAYQDKFGFPFVIAVRDYDKPAIKACFVERLDQTSEAEFVEACRQVERIAYHRIAAMFSEAGR